MARLIYLALALLALAGCSAVSLGSAPQRRWNAQAIDHYVLRTSEDLGGRACAQSVEIRGEQLVRILDNTCQHPNLWTVGWLFAHIARASQPAERCTLVDPVAGCICRNAVYLDAEYDPVQGYPRSIITHQAWQANWQSLAYWRYTALHRAFPNCTSPVNDPVYTVIVRELTILP